MSFALTPQNHLTMTEETWDEYKANPLSKRHLITVCVWANHLPEIVAAEYAVSDPGRINNCTNGPTYRAHAVGLCPEVAVVRDLCDYGKHGPVLDRRSVQVQHTGAKEIIVGNAVGLVLFGFPIAQKVEKLVVTFRDGTERTADSVIACVMEFWLQKFVSDNL
jgi:hypothetical protein